MTHRSDESDHGEASSSFSGRSEAEAHIDALAAHAQQMRASVTRSVIFNKDDIGSHNYAIADADPTKPRHVRKGSGDQQSKLPKLHESFQEKMQDPYKA